MATCSETIIARMRERTRAMRPAPAPEPEQVVSEAPIAGVPIRERMRPRLRMEDRKCDLRGGYTRIQFDYTGNGIEIRKVRGRRGAKKPRYKTHHNKRRI